MTFSQKSYKEMLRYALVGIAMGSADIVPGVSGGTIAFISGIYEKLIISIKNLSTTTLPLLLKGKIVEAIKSIPFNFFIPLGTGILLALLTLAKGIEYLLENQAVFLWSFFFGLVITSIWYIQKRITQWNPQLFIAALSSSLLAYLIIGIVPTETSENTLAFFLSGVIAICAMILPGISGSFLLIIMGKYQQILSAVNQRDILTLVTFAAGAGVGLIIFSRFLSWLFAKHHNLTIAILTGFMVGSLRKIWPWKETISTYTDRHGEILPLVEKNIIPQLQNPEIFWALLLAMIGAITIIGIEKLGNTFNKLETQA